VFVAPLECLRQRLLHSLFSNSSYDRFYQGHESPVHYQQAYQDTGRCGFDDPHKLAEELAKKGESKEKQLDCFRKVRDEIKAFVEKMPKNIAYVGRFL
jgi:hypothetical protein